MYVIFWQNFSLNYLPTYLSTYHTNNIINVKVVMSLTAERNRMGMNEDNTRD